MQALKDEAVAGSLSTLCASLVKFIVPVTTAVGLYLLMGGSLSVLDFAGFLILATKLTEPVLMVVTSISALRHGPVRGAVGSGDGPPPSLPEKKPLRKEPPISLKRYLFTTGKGKT